MYFWFAFSRIGVVSFPVKLGVANGGVGPVVGVTKVGGRALMTVFTFAGIKDQELRLQDHRE